MKRIVSLILSVLILFTFGTVAFADEKQDSFLKDLADGIIERWSLTKDEDQKHEDDMDYKSQLTAIELEHIERYQSEVFQNKEFDMLAKAYIEGCQLQRNSLKYYEDGKVLFTIQWTAGTQLRAICIISMYNNYGLNVPDELIEEFRSIVNSSIKVTQKGANDRSNPWREPLPDGITATMQLFDEDTVLLVRFKNNTGKDISFQTIYSLYDNDGREMRSGNSGCSFLGDGTEYIAVLSAPDVIGSYQMDYVINDVYKKLKEVNDALSVTSNRNSDGSVSAVFSSPVDVLVSGGIFFLDEKGDVVSYRFFDIGFSDSMEYVFDSPGVDYSDYLLSYSVYA